MEQSKGVAYLVHRDTKLVQAGRVETHLLVMEYRLPAQVRGAPVENETGLNISKDAQKHKLSQLLGYTLLS